MLRAGSALAGAPPRVRRAAQPPQACGLSRPGARPLHPGPFVPVFRPPIGRRWISPRPLATIRVTRMESRTDPMISRRAGFTIIELMITIAIVAILATIAAPSLRDIVKNARMTSLVNDLMTDLNVARAEAVKRGVSVTLC